jgi:ribosomal protein L7/L12
MPILDEIVGAGEVGKIEAIKELRERLAVDLREAKQIADKYEELHPGIFR